ncbi:transcription elongation factor GreA [Candidatus Gracilibacteria bacterium]|nr:transcription elongation factor GreA [Candidatus Gracilibacteria bacterium]
MSQIIYLTQEGFAKLQDELKYLQTEKRQDIAEKLKEAISYGDLSENSEYEEARNEQAQVELRITEIEDQLKRVEIIKEENKKGLVKKVSMGMVVMLEDVSENFQEEYKIVGTTEADILAKPAKISNESPLGKMLLGKKKGESFELKNKAGEGSEYKVIDFK